MRIKPAYILFILFALILVTRFTWLEADPPAWMEPTFVLDEGEWSDSARHHQLFGSYFADSIGVGFLMAPLYNWLVELLYGLFGIGLRQVRLLPAISNVLSTLLVTAFLWKKENYRIALITFGLLCLSPSYWAYSRLAFIEGSQLFFIVTSFVFWFGMPYSRTAALAAGISASAAVLMKPSAVYSCILPLLCAAILLYILDDQRHRASLNNLILRLALFLAGGMVGAAILFIFVILPHWDIYWETLRYQGGTGQRPMINFLTIPGSAMLSLRGGDPAIWHPFLFAPLIWVSAWGTLLWHLYLSGGKYIGYLRQMPRLERSILIFSLFQVSILLLRSWKWNSDHYYYPVIPFLAMSGSFAIERILRSESLAPVNTRPTYIHRFVSVLVFLLPAFVLTKPFFTQIIQSQIAGLNVGRSLGMSVYANATLFAVAFCMAIGLIAIRMSLHSRLIHRGQIALVLISMVAEIILMATYFAKPQFTISQINREALSTIHPGETVLGSGGSTLFLPVRVITTREVVADHRDGIAHPPPNPDIWERFQPRYILEKDIFNYSPADERYAEERKQGYELVKRYKFGPSKNLSHGPQHRYEFSLYERNPE